MPEVLPPRDSAATGSDTPATQTTALGLEMLPDDVESVREIPAPRTPVGPAKHQELAVLGDVVLESLPGSLVPEAEHLPHLTERQLLWITFRLGMANDMDACNATKVDPQEVLDWRADPAFNDYMTSCLGNKRTAFRGLMTHMLPKAARALDRLLESTNERSLEKGIALALRLQGLLVDTVRHEDPDAIRKLLEQLNSVTPYTPPQIRPRA